MFLDAFFVVVSMTRSPSSASQQMVPADLQELLKSLLDSRTDLIMTLRGIGLGKTTTCSSGMYVLCEECYRALAIPGHLTRLSCNPVAAHGLILVPAFAAKTKGVRA